MQSERACSRWRPGEEPRCVSHFAEGGGYWCPLSPPRCNVSHDNCAPVPKNVTKSCWACFEDAGNRCVEDYGVCSCEQCPCGEDRLGPACDWCKPASCDNACQATKAVRPGRRYFCEPTEYGGSSSGLNWYGILHVAGMADPRFELHVSPDTLEIIYHYGMCTEKTTVLFTAKAVDCAFKEGTTCKGVPSPCVACERIAILDVPSGSLADNFQMTKDLLQSSIGGPMYFGCDGECEVVIPALIIRLPPMRCVMGSSCSNNSQTLQEIQPLDEVEPTEGAEELSLAILLPFVLCVSAFVLCAWGCRWKAPTGSPLSVGGDSLSWRNLGFEERVRGVSGSVAAGSCLGILGPIGSGKTTLLKLLAGRLSPDRGALLLDGRKPSVGDLRRLVGFVPQHDALCAQDTIAEALAFAAALNKSGSGGGPAEAPLLAGKLDQQIGSLSGGQRRLASVYVELARRPSVLLLDEPTTGLDTESALRLTELLRAVSHSVPVVVTLHQPRPELCELLTELAVLAEGETRCWLRSPCSLSAGGNDADTDGSGLVACLAACLARHGHPCQDGYNPLDLAIDAVAHGVVLDCDAPLASAPKAARGEAATTSVKEEEGPVLVMESSSNVKSGVGGWRRAALRPPLQLVLLLVRSVKRGLRSKPYVRYLATLAVGLLLGAIFFQLDVGIAGVRNRLGVLFLFHAFLALRGVGATQEASSEHLSTEHEITSGAFSRPVHAMARTVGFTVAQMPHGMLLLLPYLMAGLRTDGGRPAIFCLCLCAVAAASAGISAAARGPGAATAANVLLLLLSGLVINNGSVRHQPLLAALQTISPFWYSFEVLAAQELVDLATTFNPEGYAQLQVFGETWLTNFRLISALDADWSNQGKYLGVCLLGWLLVALLSQALPPLPYWRLERVPWKCAHAQRHGGRTMVESMRSAPSSMPEGVDLDLTWEVSSHDVRGLSGGARRGDLHALAGPIGSGKTTLLCALGGRVAGVGVTVSVNGEAMQASTLRGLAGYVPQQDSLCPDDTVAQAISFAAAMVGNSTGWGSPGNVAAPLLVEKMDQRIGTLSGGQRRLASVYVELARRPHFLLLDEPTSSLDAETALRLMKLLQEVSQSIPVVLSLHQPRPEICELLTHITILSNGEELVCAPFPDFARCAGGKRFTSALDEVLRHPDTAERFHQPFQPSTHDGRAVPAPRSGAGGRHVVRVLVRECRRTWALRSCVHLVLAVLVGLLVGLAYKDMPRNTMGMLNRTGFFFVVNALLGVLALPRLFAFERSWSLVEHELLSKVFQPWVFHSAQVLAEVPRTLLSTGAAALMLLALVPMHPGPGHRAAFFLYCLATGLVSVLLVHACTTVAPARAAVPTFAGTLIVLLLFGGPFVDPVAPGAVALQYLSFFRLAYHLMMVNELSGQEFSFDLVTDESTGATQELVVVQGEEWLQQLHLVDQPVLHALGLALWGALFWGLAVLGLHRRLRPRARAAPSSEALA